MNDLLLLSTLLTGPRHGYALKKQIALITGQGEMHNNLVYPLLKRFVRERLVTRRESSGERGQTRELYAITARGRAELVRRLSEFPPKAAASAEAFAFRIGLFEFLDASVRAKILGEREQWLAHRIEKLGALRKAMDLGDWGGEVVGFLRRQAQAEHLWISRLRKRQSRR